MKDLTAAEAPHASWALDFFPQGTLEQALRTLAAAVGYFILAVISRQFQFTETPVSPLCIASGFGLAITLRYGYQAGAGIFIGALCAILLRFYLRSNPELVTFQGFSAWLSANPLWLIAGAAVASGATMEALLATMLIRAYHAREDLFGNIHGVIVFCLAALVASALTSIISTGVQFASGSLVAEQVGVVWVIRWLSHLGGVLLFTPFLMLWGGLTSTRPNLDATALLAGTALLALFVVAQLALSMWSTPYLMFPILLLIAFRFGAPAATAGAVIVAVTAVAATARGTGLFARDDPMETIVILQGFVAVVSLTVLVLDATISERRRAFAEAQMALQRFQVLFKSVPNGVIAVDSKGVIVHINEQIETMFGYDRGELIGMPVEVLVPLRARASHAKLRTHFSDAPEARPMGAGRELFGRRKDGSEFPIEIGLAPCHDSTGPLILASVVDITERKEMEAQHQSLLRRMWQAIDAERLRLAHELHDETGQSVTAVMLQLERIEKDLDELGRARLRWLRRQLEQMGSSLHRIVWELRPASLDELGLRNVLANYVSDWAEQSGIHGDFHCRDDGLDEIKDELRTIIYRVVQEALTNIVKHAAGAKTASVIVDSDQRMIRVTIEDDGCGFDHSQTSIQPSHGLGLAGMRERLTLVRGELDIESTPKLGTTLFVRIPRDRGVVQ